MTFTTLAKKKIKLLCYLSLAVHVHLHFCVVSSSPVTVVYTNVYDYYSCCQMLLSVNIRKICSGGEGNICDQLWKNRPLAIFHENHVLGADRRRIYCRVQRSKNQALKSFLSRVMAKKMYTGHLCLSSQFFEKQSV